MQQKLLDFDGFGTNLIMDLVQGPTFLRKALLSWTSAGLGMSHHW